MSHSTTRFALALALGLLTSCQSKYETEDTQSPPPVEEAVPVDLSAWTSEHIPLPPGFAPSLPAGDELLLFAPGMFDAGSEDFWSYVFLIELDAPMADTGHLQSFLELYYDGLITAVGSGEGMTPPETPATVYATSNHESLEHAVFGFEIDLVDTFVTQEPLHLFMSVVEESPTRFRFQASPQPRTHAIWRTLAAAAASLEL